MEPVQQQATAILITQIIQAGLGAVSLALLVFVFGPRLRRVSRRVFRLERRFARAGTSPGVARGTITPPGGVPISPEDYESESTKG